MRAAVEPFCLTFRTFPGRAAPEAPDVVLPLLPPSLRTPEPLAHPLSPVILPGLPRKMGKPGVGRRRGGGYLCRASPALASKGCGRRQKMCPHARELVFTVVRSRHANVPVRTETPDQSAPEQ